MRTLLLCPELFARESGIQRILRLYLQALCEAAADDGDVRLVVLNDREFPEKMLHRYANGRLGFRRACGRSKPAFVWQAVRAAARVDRVICGHLAQLPVAWLARCLHPGLRYDLVAHGIEVWRPFTGMEKIALRRVRRILCVSEFTRHEMYERAPSLASRLVVVPNALDPVFGPLPGSALPIRDAVPEILAVTRLDSAEQYKGVDHLIEALPAVRLAVPAARLRIVGGGSDLPRLQQLAARTGMSDSVDFAGPVDDETLREAYRSCALFALPSRGEGFGIVFLEAMAHGKPCLGARAGAIPEIIDETTGVLVDYGDVHQLGAQLAWALQHRWDPDQIRQRAAQFSFPAFKERLGRALAA